LGLVFNPKKRKAWGTVFDATTKYPLPGATVLLVDEGNHVAETIKTDKDGRYGFLATHGTYFIKTIKEHYTLQASSQTDMLYGELYTGSLFTIEQDEQGLIIKNIALSPQSFNWKLYAEQVIKRFSSIPMKFLKLLFPVLYAAGFLFTTLAAILTPSLLNTLILLLYILLFVYSRLYKKEYGTVISNKTGKPLPFTQITLYDPSHPTQRKVLAIADTLGRYYAMVPNGSYLMKIQGNILYGDSFERTGTVAIRDGVLKEDIRI
jgi:hypothetical protein